MAWNHTKNGQVTVKSAYHLCMSMGKSNSGRPESSSSVDKHRGWLNLWDTNAPNKAKIHVWRLISNGLAVGAELHRRRIKPGIFCPACGREETTFHRFWGCPHSVQFWTSLRTEKGITVAIPPFYNGSQNEVARWMLGWFADARAEEREMMVQATYGLWLARNAARDGHKIADPLEIMQSVLAFVDEWRAVHGDSAKVRRETPNQKWQPPEQGWLKANADGAVTKFGGKAGTGVVIRDHMGAFRAGACDCRREDLDPEMAEIKACKRAIQVASELSAERLHLELDSATVVAMINASGKNLSASGPCIEEIKEMLKSFQDVKVTWVRRSANSAADKLAKFGLSEELCKVWFSFPPDSILEIIADDIPSVF
jgi:ribonuclease HI